MLLRLLELGVADIEEEADNDYYLAVLFSPFGSFLVAFGVLFTVVFPFLPFPI